MLAFTPAETHTVLHTARTGELAARAAGAGVRAAARAGSAGRGTGRAHAPVVRVLVGRALVAAGTRLLGHDHGFGRGPAHPHAA
ncbi:hypothetical protein [Streptomyces sp. G-G2]|uniref:hypothetical protein n=1 Tax=Streptomyces sp. G-G2 TaxID=3046201 RepID=UPI0024BAA3AE|nr:hypothetical protein [Streptomyces sp. G-G2]MDJ0379595.1 hypothetical protein [Streptomyces sp. G-G2]